jgi:tRNA threonylcarbamoyl adenosine modification protein (Sua5/YciO/YrdC/YwlC family)
VTDRIAATGEGIAEAARMIGDGALVAFPTDTVHGVGCRPDDPEALERLFILKGRPPERRIAWLVAGLEQAAGLGLAVGDAARALAEACWPGGLTLVLRASGRTDGATTLGIRAPDHPTTQALLAATGPLPVSSANPHGFPECYTADDVLVAFAGAADLAAVIEGDSPGGVASSVLDLTGDRPRLLREGAVGRDRIEGVVGPID